MDAHQGQAAWFGAFATMGAIFFSSLFAVWVPRHLHAVSERNLVQRAINNLLIAIGLTAAAWQSLLHALKNGEYNDGTPDLLSVQIASARTAAEQIPASVLMGESFVLVHSCLLKLVTLEKVMVALEPEKTRQETAERVAFPDVLDELEELSQDGAKLRPKKVAGFWMIHSARDDEPA